MTFENVTRPLVRSENLNGIRSETQRFSSANDCNLGLRLACMSHDCGVGPMDGTGTERRIVGGRLARTGSRPGFVALELDGKLQCGATLIAPQWALTAAHCFREFWMDTSESKLFVGMDPQMQSKNIVDKSVIARVGAHRLSSRSPFQQWSRVSFVVQHSMFSAKTALHDIALVKLETPIATSDFAFPACLPSDTALFTPGVNRTCFVVGMGSRAFGERTSGELEETEVRVWDWTQCRRFPPINAKRRVQATQLCAGREGGGHDACLGDSGGPLLCWENEHWSVEGVTSLGFGCGLPHTPGLYTSVRSYRHWIEGVMRENGDVDTAKKETKSCPVMCISGKCVQEREVCDGVADCPLAEDEEDCSIM